MQSDDAEAAFKQMKGQSRKIPNVACCPGFRTRWQVGGHRAIECRAETLEAVEAALNPRELCLPRVWPPTPEFDASFSFLYISHCRKAGFRK